MKKLILLLLLIPSLAWGQVSTSGVSLSGCSSGGASAAKSCPSSATSLIDNIPDDDDFVGVIGTGITTNYGPVGQRYTPAANTRICSIVYNVRSCAGSGATYAVEIYDISGGTTLGTPASGCTSGTKAITSGAAHEFTGLNCALTASTEYAILITSSNGDESNYCSVFYGGTDVISGNYCQWKSDKTIYDNRTTWDFSFEMWGFTE